ncbi:aldehyde dehydrogenase [Sphingopyxis sp.]|uniref:aldehyde dehydrogenase n=1 Tax=Sphingopyxis sp. TaxID=1908224 RepID=UPI003D6CCFF1
MISLTNRDRHFIDGQWARPVEGGRIEVINPATAKRFGEAPDGSVADIDAAVRAARLAFDNGPWPRMSAEDRATFLQRMADYLLARAEETTHLIIQEMGAPIAFLGRGGTAPAAMLNYYADLAVELPPAEQRQGLAAPYLVRREPVGVVAAIVPWNGPLFLLLAKCAPAMAAGCTVVAKPAPETPLDGFLLADAAEAAGLPPGVLNIVPGGREAGEALVSHPLVDKVSFTGSTAAGRKIGEICGRDLRRCGLELGGKSAAIVLDDADPQLVADFAVPLGLGFNSGQACAALTRIIVPRARQKDFVEALSAKVSELRVGDPHDPATTIGPMVAKRQQERVQSYIDGARADRFPIAAGGDRLSNLPAGWFVPPTLFYDVSNASRIAQEEIFGPVGVVIPYDGGDEEALAIANDSPYGLAGAVFSAEPARGYSIIKRLRAGTVGYNSFGIDFTAPFGGFKASGVGREMGREGLGQYHELKTVTGLGEEPD